MPKKAQEAAPIASPELVFKPPPRRTYDNFDDMLEGCSEPRRSDESSHPRTSSKKSSLPARAPVPRPGPSSKSEGRPSPVAKEGKAKKKSGLAQKHSHEDLKAQAEAEDFAAPFRDGVLDRVDEVRRGPAATRKVAAQTKLQRMEHPEDLASPFRDAQAHGSKALPRKPAPIGATPSRLSNSSMAASKPILRGQPTKTKRPGSMSSSPKEDLAAEMFLNQEQEEASSEEIVLEEVPMQSQKRKPLQTEVQPPISIMPQGKLKKKLEQRTSSSQLQLSLSSQVTANFPAELPAAAKSATSATASERSSSSESGPLAGDGMEAALLEALRSEGPEAVNAFQAALAEGTQPVQSVKLCFVGHARAGKTSTLNALAGRTFNPEQPSTHGVETCSFAKELMSAGPSRTNSSSYNDDAVPSEPWLEMEGEGSVAKLLEEKVAKAVADNMKARARRDRCARPSRGPKPASDASSDEADDGGGPPLLVKMPVDLIIKAISNEDAPHQRDVIMQTWDFAGQQMYYNMAHVFLTSFGIYALVLDISKWDDGEAHSPALESVDFWLAALLVHAPDAWLVIVGSHADQLDSDRQKEVYKSINGVLVERLQQAHQHAKVHGNEAEGLLFFPVDNRGDSAQSLHGISRLREALNSLALDVAKALEVIPTRWAHFFHVLEGQSQERYIEIENCREQAAAMGIHEIDLEKFLGLFHKLGQLLYFKESPAVVLSPQWLLDAMAQVVGCPVALERRPLQAQALRERGDLCSDLLKVLWQDERFQGHETVLQAFLEHFDLLVPGSGKAPWLVPSLLPRRPETTAARSTPEVVFVLDFKGAFRRLLSTLIPRLLCQLRKRYGSSNFQVFEAYGDFAQLLLGHPPVLVTFDMYPAEAPEVLKVEVTAADQSTSPNLEDLLGSLHAALEAWLPHVSYDTKLPCPCGATTASTQGHYLNLSEVLANVPIFCRHSAGLVRAADLPAPVRAWRERPPGARATAAVERPFMYMYSSPLYTKINQFPQLNVHKEFETLQGLLGGCTTQVATYKSLENAMQMRPAPSVLHLSCHSVPLQVGGSVRHFLLLEDEKGCGHLLDAQGLQQMGGWENLGLLVLLACNSVAIARELPCRAICCTNKVSDSAVRDFCQSFYLHLFTGRSVREAWNKGRNALRNHADTGLRAEAERFLFWSPEREEEPVFAPPRGDAAEGTPWPSTPPVEKYRIQALDLAALAEKFEFLERRVILLTGPEGAGKTTTCRFFCRFFGAPGRLFAEGVALLGRKEMELLFEKDGCLQHLLAKMILDALNVQAWATCAWSTLTSLTRNRRWLLVLDGIDLFQSDKDIERLRKPLEDLLCTCTKLCVVLTRRSSGEGTGRPWELAKLDTCKVVPFPLSRLSDEDAALLFLDRIVRKLFPRDFDLEDDSPEPLSGGRDLLQKLQRSPLMQALAGVPGEVVNAAARVDCELHSLLEHPILRRNVR